MMEHFLINNIIIEREKNQRTQICVVVVSSTTIEIDEREKGEKEWNIEMRMRQKETKKIKTDATSLCGYLLRCFNSN